MGSRQFSGREIDDSLLKEVQEAEKEYWREKESEIKKPFTYYYEEGYAGIYTSVYVANFMLLILTAVAVCGIFADEKISGTDQIIFSSVQKEKLFAAKILAGFSMGVLLALYLFAALADAAFAMFLSQVLGSRSAATAIMVMGLFLSMLNIPEKLGTFSKIWRYLSGAYIGSWTFTEYRLISVFGRFFNNLQAAPVLWLLASAVFLGIAKAACRGGYFKQE